VRYISLVIFLAKSYKTDIAHRTHRTESVDVRYISLVIFLAKSYKADIAHRPIEPDPEIPDLKMLTRARNAVWMSK